MRCYFEVMNKGFSGVRDATEEAVYRDLHTLLHERSPRADSNEQEHLSDLRDVMANMEADLAERMDELEALRGEPVFDPDQYNQSFTYAGKRIQVLNQSSRLIVDIADEAYLGEPYRVTLSDLKQCYRAVQDDVSPRHDRFYRDAVDTVMRRERFGPDTTPDREMTERHLRSALTKAGYTHAYLYGDTETRLDDVLALARTPLKERPTEADGYTVRMQEEQTRRSGLSAV